MATMNYGQTYYISAVVTKVDQNETPLFDPIDNPCIDVSFGSPVTFFPLPSASLSLSSSEICLGDAVDITFDIQGIGPFDITYFDGTNLETRMAVSDSFTVSATPQFSTNIFIQTISQNGIVGCSDNIMPGLTDQSLTVNEPLNVTPVVQHCNILGTMAVLTFAVTGGDPSTYTVDGIPGIFKGNEFTSDSLPSNTMFSFTVEDVNSCPSAPITGTVECFCTPDIQVEINTLRDITCRGEADAILTAEPINGAEPYSYFWSTGSMVQDASNVPPGATFVTMTDGNGCQVTDTVDLVDPPELIATFNVRQPSCHNDRDGALLFVQVEGGTGNYSYSFNGGPFQASDIREGFGEGTYPLAVSDENGCLVEAEGTVINPSPLAVSLGGTGMIALGESFTLSPQPNQEIVGIIWESRDTSLCPDCPNPVVSPTRSERYKVTVVNTAGCTASDQILVMVSNDQRVFVPSVFSPNGDGNNDLLRPFSGPEVDDVAMFRVINRWGELVYENLDMDDNNALEGWNGETLRGDEAPTGVYIYFAEVNFKNGTSTIIRGDVSLVR